MVEGPRICKPQFDESRAICHRDDLDLRLRAPTSFLRSPRGTPQAFKTAQMPMPLLHLPCHQTTSLRFGLLGPSFQTTCHVKFAD